MSLKYLFYGIATFCQAYHLCQNKIHMKTNITFLFLLIAFGSFTQNKSVLRGVIYSASDSTNVIPGVIVEIDSDFRTQTNSKGEFSFTALPEGNRKITISHSNYITQVTKIGLAENATVNLKLYLIEPVMDLPEAIVQQSTIIGSEKGIKELPGSAYYLSPKELQKFNYTDINRTLRSIPGVNIQEEDGFGLRPNIGLRGSGVERSSKITIMEDGILMAPAPYSAPAAYYFPTIGRMQSIEILKGSSQIKYGPYTTGGAINMLSTQLPEQLAARVSLSAGSFGNRILHAFAGNSHEQVAYSVETFQHSADGFKVLDNGGSTGFDKADYLFKLRFNSKKTAKIYQALTFKVGETFENSNETYLGLAKADFDLNPNRRYAASQMDNMTTKQRQLSANYFIQPLKFMSISSTVYRNDFKRNWYKLDAVKDSTGIKKSISSILEDPLAFNDSYAIIGGQSSVLNDALYVKGNNREYYSQGVQTIIGFDFKTGYLKHKIDLGFRYHQDEQDRYQYEDQYKMADSIMLLTKAGDPGRESNRVNFAIAAASYIQYKLIYKRWTATTGVRHEYITLTEKDYGKNDPNRLGTALVENQNQISAFIPGIALDFKVNLHLAAFLGLHKGFAPAGVKEGSLPEESINYEAGIKYYRPGFSGQLVGFMNQYENLLGADLAAGGGAGTGDFFNGGKALTQGIEFQAIYDLMHSFKSKFNLPLTIGYTLTDAYFQSSFSSTNEDWGNVSSGDQLPYLATHQFSTNLSLEHARFSLNIGLKYTSEMRASAGQGEILEDQLIPSYLVLDASAKFTINKNISFFASATNIGNTVYVVAIRPAGFRPGMPRAFQLGMKVNL
jgi:Fe(3+) dicitrate transport protein